jgi:hypothetical protein
MVELDAAIFATLDGDRQSNGAGSLGTLGVTGVYANGDVPENAAPPYVRFGPLSEQASNMMSVGPIEYENVYMVLAVVEGNDKTPAGAIAARVKSLLHKRPLTPAAPLRHLATLLDQRLDIPDRLQGRTFEQVGANYRIWTEET